MRTAFRGVFGILSRGGVASVRTGAHQHTDNTHCPWQVTAGFCAAAILALLSGPVAAQGFWGGVNDGISRSLEVFGRAESLNLQREQVELERRRLSIQEQQAAQAQHQADLEASTVSQRNAARADEFAVAKQMLELAHPRLKTDGALRKRREHQVVPFVYAGAAIMSPSLFADAPKGEFSLTKMFDRANEQERLFGLRLDGVWMHVGTPDAVQAAEEAVLESVA